MCDSLKKSVWHMIGFPLFATPSKMSLHSFGEDQKPDSGDESGRNRT